MEAQHSLKAGIQRLDAGTVVVSDAAGKNLAQHVCVQIDRDIGSPCTSSKQYESIDALRLPTQTILLPHSKRETCQDNLLQTSDMYTISAEHSGGHIQFQASYVMGNSGGLTVCCRR